MALVKTIDLNWLLVLNKTSQETTEMTEPMITSAGAEDAANDLVGDASNEDALLYYVLMSTILASFGAVCQILFENAWIERAEEYHSILVNNFLPLTIGYVMYLAFPDTPLVTSALLFLIASSVEGPWWEMWGEIASRVQNSERLVGIDTMEMESLMFYVSLGVQVVLTLAQMFAQAFLLPKVYDWADSQEKFAPIYM